MFGVFLEARYLDARSCYDSPMWWIRAHPFAVLFALAGLTLLLIVGATTQRSASPVGGPVINISAGNISPTVTVSAPSDNSYGVPVEPSNSTLQAPEQPAPLPSAPVAPAQPPSQPQPTSPAITITTRQSSNQNASTGSQPDTSAGDALLQLAQSFTVGGLAVNVPAQTPSRTPEQQALYAYGNKAGLVVLSFENAHPDMGQTLQNWLDHRADASQQAQVRSIAADMSAASAALSALSGVPQPAAAANAQLAAGFTTAATQLQAVVAASGDGNALVESMKTYDSAADAFTKSYLAVVDVFALHEVTFGSSDPGSVFSMPMQ